MFLGTIFFSYRTLTFINLDIEEKIFPPRNAIKKLRGIKDDILELVETIQNIFISDQKFSSFEILEVFFIELTP